jgi:PIN domain nuclease of toxin-antitoxin system
VKLLLDTHVVVWSQDSPDRLGARTRKLLVSEANDNLVCAISALELGQLVHAGRLALRGPLLEWWDAAIAALCAEAIPMTAEVAAGAYALPGELHRDPADRILIACARDLELALLTADERILAYRQVKTVDARR